MSWYERVVFNRVLECLLDSPRIHAEREQLLASCSGEILEVGIGTGLNLPDYPAQVHSVTSLSPDRDLDPRARERAARRGMDVRHIPGDAGAMPFENDRFDAVVCTFVLCSVPDPRATVGEMARVLRPQGRLFFWEHVVAPQRFTHAVQRALNVVNPTINCGCHLVRDTRNTLAEAFRFESIDEFDAPGFVLPIRHVVRGIATPRRDAAAMDVRAEPS